MDGSKQDLGGETPGSLNAEDLADSCCGNEDAGLALCMEIMTLGPAISRTCRTLNGELALQMCQLLLLFL